MRNVCLAALLLVFTSFATPAHPSKKEHHGKKPPHTSVSIQNNTAGTVIISLAYYDASNNLLQGNAQHSVAASATVSDSGPAGAYSVIATLTSSVKALDFWSYDYLYSGGCTSSPTGVTSGQFYTTTSYGSYLLLLVNTGCR